MKTRISIATAGMLAVTLAACGQKPSAVAPQGVVSYAPAGESSSGSAANYGTSYAARAPTPLFEGKPMWAPNRRHSAQENAQFQFARNGGDFGARSETDYVAKVHAFVDRPPRDAETIDRANGDRLIYDRRGNTFAVVSRDGAPRTMFKPRDGASYWDQQKDREAKRSKANSGSGDGDQS